jgi:hypothetical protein
LSLDRADASVKDASPDADYDAPIAIDAGPDASVCDLATHDNDSCTGIKELVHGETVYGDTTGYTSDQNLLATDCTSNVSNAGDAVYKVEATTGQTITATLTPDGPGDWDPALYIVDACVSPTCLVGSDQLGANLSEQVELPVSADATYYIIVDGATPIAAYEGCYVLTVEVQ